MTDRNTVTRPAYTAKQYAALIAELEAALNLPRVLLAITHDYACPLTKIGKKHGPCKCGAFGTRQTVQLIFNKLHIVKETA